MTKLTKLPIFFLSIENLVNTYSKNEKMDIDNLGIIANKNIILSQVLYSNKLVKTKPYSLSIDKESYVPSRKIIIKYFIEEIIIPKFHLGRSTSTIYSITTSTIQFINWADDSNNINFPNNIHEARSIFVEYTYHLKTSIRAGNMETSTAHVHHKYALNVLKYIFKDDKNFISLGIKLIPNTRVNKTTKSTDYDKKYHFRFYYTIFHEVTNFLLNKEPYPLQLKLPNNDIWILPSSHVYVRSEDNAPIAFNYKTGNAKTLLELKSKYKKKWEAQRCLNDYNQNIYINNKSFDSEKRLLLATSAAQAFYMLFLSITGMNDSTAATLLWNDDYSMEKSSQRFRNIKYRAGNKNVEFEIRHRFIRDFRKYLELRKYLLGDNKFDYLFFANYRDQATLSKRHINGGLSNHINTKFKKRIDPNLPMVNSRQLRVNKTHQIIKTDGIVAASQVSQSSINTIITSYQGESIESCEEQFIDYFENLNEQIFKTNSSDEETAIGHCKTPDKPTSQIQFNSTSIDCSSQEGCLFCEGYALHQDKQDLNKLYSLKYIILESRYLAKDIDHFNKVYSTTLNRIDNIFNDCISLNRISREELKSIEDDVFIDENLHPYWEHKLSTLIKMGVIK